MKQLLIAYDYKPVVSPESIQSERLVRYLEDEGINTHILTKEMALSTSVSVDENITRAKTLESKFNKAINYVFCKRNLFMPDTKKSWIPFAVDKGRDILDNNQIDFVQSWSSPLSSHLVALELRKERQFFWVAHFSDPWVDNIYIRYPSKKIRDLNKEWEEEVFEKCDLLVFTSQESVDLIMSKYGNRYLQKTIILPHTFDPKAINKLDSIYNSHKVVLSHVGNFYGNRTPNTIIESVRMVKQRIGAELSQKVEIKLIGRIPDKYCREIAKCGLDDVIKVIGSVPYNESQSYMSSSDVLINVDAKDAVSVFLPSKLVEYMAHQKLILGITPGNGTTNRILRENGHIVFENDDISGICDFLIKLSQDGIDLKGFNLDAYKDYQPSVIAKDFANEVTKRKG